jgi:hypothetical protein
MLKLVAVSALTWGLSACGGGGDSSSSSDGSANGDLYAAFELINQGMSYEQVRDVVGFDYNDGKDDFGGSDLHYKWVTGKGTADVALLQVGFKNGGAVSKIVGGSRGHNSKFW